MEQVLSFELKNDLSESKIIINAIEKFWSENDLNHEILFNVNLAMDEVFSNIVKHAFKDKEHHIIFFNAYRDENIFKIEFIDDGGEFNPTRLQEPDLGSAIENREPGGLGIFLLKNFSESINYRREAGRNKLLVTFNLNNGEN